MLSQHFFFITERITDILKLEEEKEVLYSNDERIRKQRITKSLMVLHKVLSPVVDHLRDIERGRDEQQRDHHQLYLHQQLRHIADDSDDILNDTYDGSYTANGINNLVDRIRNFDLKPPAGTTYIFNTGGNNNFSGQQRIGPIIISTDQAESSQIKRVTRPKTYGEYPDSDLVGFKQEIQTLLDHLTQDNETRAVVGIVGMGGIGKTTLAKHIYHHPKCDEKFIIKTWVCISESWDKTSILKEICSQVVPEAKEMDYGEAISLLSKRLRSQPYLLVLDDMWSIDAWNHISPAFPPKSNGSKVVVTSRNKAVPQLFNGIIRIVEPKPLDDKESWELFKKKVLLPQNISDMQLKLGEDMVWKCEGLPLAIVALAGVLKMGSTVSYWQRVSKTLTHKILQMNNESTQGFVNEVLELSYDELPHHLKQCVLYLRLFPEDYVIDAGKLVKMWIAEGLISTNEEYTAEEYIEEIVQRYIVKVVKTNFMGQVVQIKIHDLIRQMFVDIDQKKCFFKDPLRLATFNNYEENSTLLSNSESQSNVLERIFGTGTSSQVRSIIFHPLILSEDNILQRLFGKFRLLRVLILCNIRPGGRVMPQEMGNLIHLRYLELDGFINLVESSIENLGNLWTLYIRNIYGDEAVMILNLDKLKELRHLYFPSSWYHRQLNLELGRLKNLKTLWNVKGGDWLLSTMPVLSADILDLRIFIYDQNRMENSKEQLEVVFRTPSITSNNLQTLKMSWLYGYYELHDMNMLSKCTSLKKLRLEGRIKVGMPVIFPVNLIKLTLVDTCLEEREVMNIISESCHYLKILTLGERAYNGSELVCNANSFLQLEKLTLKSQWNLRMWIIETSAMPSLCHLTIREGMYSDVDLNPEGWTFISKIPQLTYEGCKEKPFEEKLRVYRKDDQNLNRSSNIYVTNYNYWLRRCPAVGDISMVVP